MTGPQRHHVTCDHNVTVRISAKDGVLKDCVGKVSLVQQQNDKGHGFMGSKVAMEMTKSKVGCVLRSRAFLVFRVRNFICIMLIRRGKMLLLDLNSKQYCIPDQLSSGLKS